MIDELLIYLGILLVLAVFLSPIFLWSHWTFKKSLNRSAADYWNMVNTAGFSKEDFIVGNFVIGPISKGLTFRDFNGKNLGKASLMPSGKMTAEVGGSLLAFVDSESNQKINVVMPSYGAEGAMAVCDYLGIKRLHNHIGKTRSISRQEFTLPSGETLSIEFGMAPGLKEEFSILCMGVEVGKLIRTKQQTANSWVLLLPAIYPIHLKVVILSLQLIHR